MEQGYSVLASFYDRLMSDVPYQEIADFYRAVFSRFCVTPRSVLDLGCGTGTLTSLLSSAGYDMIGIDRSQEMLALADARAKEEGQDILFVCQDMRAIDLYGTVDAAVCSLDCVNYLTDRGDLERCFSSVGQFLNPGGLFLFDVNTPWKFEHVFGDRSYILEEDDYLVAWQNDYKKSTGMCYFDLTIFAKTPAGLWSRSEESQRQRAYSDRRIQKALLVCGFELLGIVSGFSFEEATPTDERHTFLCRKIQ
ncbi:MAG: class I SAM-dependent methyltransferase [Clostridia bacterium]|nr:class I SAM-dependent methyltransferase [Clostridia bacterium]